MALALEQAELAAEQGEVPVGAVVVCGDELIAVGHNLTISNNDPSAHAEIVTLRKAGQRRENYRLPDCDLYVTLEPCAMCVGALIHSRIANLYFAADDPKAGAVHSAVSLIDAEYFNHSIKWHAGILAEPASMLLKNFFRRRR